MVLSEDELWEERKKEARDLKGIGYRDNPFFETIIAVTKKGGLYVWKTCAEWEEGERVAREYAERVGVPYLGVLPPSRTRRLYGR